VPSLLGLIDIDLFEAQCQVFYEAYYNWLEMVEWCFIFLSNRLIKWLDWIIQYGQSLDQGWVKDHLYILENVKAYIVTKISFINNVIHLMQTKDKISVLIIINFS